MVVKTLKCTNLLNLSEHAPPDTLIQTRLFHQKMNLLNTRNVRPDYQKLKSLQFNFASVYIT